MDALTNNAGPSAVAREPRRARTARTAAPVGTASLAGAVRSAHALPAAVARARRRAAAARSATAVAPADASCAVGRAARHALTAAVAGEACAARSARSAAPVGAARATHTIGRAARDALAAAVADEGRHTTAARPAAAVAAADAPCANRSARIHGRGVLDAAVGHIVDHRHVGHVDQLARVSARRDHEDRAVRSAVFALGHDVDGDASSTLAAGLALLFAQALDGACDGEIAAPGRIERAVEVQRDAQHRRRARSEPRSNRATNGRRAALRLDEHREHPVPPPARPRNDGERRSIRRSSPRELRPIQRRIRGAARELCSVTNPRAIQHRQLGRRVAVDDHSDFGRVRDTPGARADQQHAQAPSQRARGSKGRPHRRRQYQEMLGSREGARETLLP
jgi:hypothetical protein